MIYTILFNTVTPTKFNSKSYDWDGRIEFQTYHEDSVFGGPYTLFGIEFNSLFQLHNQTHTARSVEYDNSLLKDIIVARYYNGRV